MAYTYRDDLSALELEQARIAVEAYILERDENLSPQTQQNLSDIAQKLATEAKERHREEVG